MFDFDAYAVRIQCVRLTFKYSSLIRQSIFADLVYFAFHLWQFNYLNKNLFGAVSNQHKQTSILSIWIWNSLVHVNSNYGISLFLCSVRWQVFLKSTNLLHTEGLVATGVTTTISAQHFPINVKLWLFINNFFVKVGPH